MVDSSCSSSCWESGGGSKSIEETSVVSHRLRWKLGFWIRINSRWERRLRIVSIPCCVVVQEASMVPRTCCCWMAAWRRAVRLSVCSCDRFLFEFNYTQIQANEEVSYTWPVDGTRFSTKEADVLCFHPRTIHLKTRGEVFLACVQRPHRK